MAVAYTVPNSFSPLTVAESAKVNANETYTKSVFDGLEATTTTFAKLKVDANPATALEVATKQYVDNYATYRRPVLQYSTGSVVALEAGINGTSGQARILFPDGTIRSDSTTSRIDCNLAQVAALSGTARSGVRTGTVAANTWYAIYAVKVSDSSTNFVTVADTVIPTQTNYSSLNSNFGTNSWVYLGTIRYGDNSTNTTTILPFAQCGNTTIFRNNCTATAENGTGILLADTGAAGTLTYAYSAGTGATDIPAHFPLVWWGYATGIITNTTLRDNTLNVNLASVSAVSGAHGLVLYVAANGVKIASSGSVAAGIFLSGFVDSVLGVGSNPIL